MNPAANILDSLEACQARYTRTNTHKSTSSDSDNGDLNDRDLQRVVQDMEKAMRVSSTIGAEKTVLARIQSLSIALYNASRVEQNERISAMLKHAAGLGLMCTDYDTLQCASVFASAGRKYENLMLSELSKTCFSHVLNQLEGTSETEKKRQLVIVAIIGVAKAYLSPGAPSDDVDSALQYLQGGLNIPTLKVQDVCHIFELLYKTSLTLSKNSRFTESIEWIKAIEQAQIIIMKHEVTHEVHADLKEIFSNSMLLKCENLLELTKTAEAEAIIHQHDIQPSLSNVDNYSSTQIKRSLKDYDRWYRCRVLSALQNKDIKEALVILKNAIDFARKTSLPKGAEDDSSDSSLDGPRLDHFLSICVNYAEACNWANESLQPFVQLAEAASECTEERATQAQRTADNTKVGDKRVSSDIVEYTENGKARVFSVVLRRLIVELISYAKNLNWRADKNSAAAAAAAALKDSDSYRGSNHVVPLLPTSQLMQAASMLKSVPFLANSAFAHKTVTSLLAEYSHFLLSNAHYSDCEMVVRMLQVNIQDASTKFIDQNTQSNEGTSSNDSGRWESRVERAAHLVLAGVLYERGRLAEALAENMHVKRLSDFQVQHQRFEIFVKALETGLPFDELVASLTDEMKTLLGEPFNAALLLTTKEPNSSQIVGAITKCANNCVTAADPPYRGLLAVAHTLQTACQSPSTDTTVDSSTNDKNRNALRVSLCNTLKQIAEKIAKREYPGEIQGQIFATLLSEQMQSVTTGSQRSIEVLNTMKIILAAIHGQMTPKAQESQQVESTAKTAAGVIEMPSSITPFDISSFGSINNLRFCLRSAVAVLNQHNLQLSEDSSVMSPSNSGTRSSERENATKIAGELYSILDEIQQAVNYREVPRSKLLALQASNALKLPMYNYDEVKGKIVAARTELRREANVQLSSQHSEQDTDALLAIVEFKLCAQTYLPDSESEVLSLIARFQHGHAYARTPGFFESLASIIMEVCGRPGHHIQISALCAELENRVSACQKIMKSKRGSLDDSAYGEVKNAARCFRQLIEYETNDRNQIKWMQKAFDLARMCILENSDETSNKPLKSSASPSSKHTYIYPLDELSWLASTAWNCGLMCQKVGGKTEGVHFLAIAIKFAQLREGVVRPSELESMVQWYSDSCSTSTSIYSSISSFAQCKQ